MFCKKCGKEVIGDPKFCSSCGATISEQTASTNRRGSVRGLRLAAWVLWGSLFVSLLLYVVIANIMGSDAGGFDEDFSLVKYVLYVIGAVLLIVAFLLRWAFRKWIRSAVLRDFLIIILPGALCVAVGIYGLIIFIMRNADWVSLYVLVGVAALSLVFMRPSGEAG